MGGGGKWLVTEDPPEPNQPRFKVKQKYEKVTRSSLFLIYLKKKGKGVSY